MKYKFKLIDISLILMIPITVGDFKEGFILASVLDLIILCCGVRVRIDDMKRGKYERTKI